MTHDETCPCVDKLIERLTWGTPLIPNDFCQEVGFIAFLIDRLRKRDHA